MSTQPRQAWSEDTSSEPQPQVNKSSYTKVADSTSKTPVTKGGKCCGRKTKICFTVIGLIVGIAAIVFGALFPTIVHNLQVAGIKDSVQINPEKLSGSDLDKFVDDFVYDDVYVWNITNLYQVMTAGAKINVELLGAPIKTKSWSTKFNYQTSADTSTLTYDSLDAYEILYNDPFTAANINSMVVTVNPVYLGVMALTGRSTIMQATTVPPITEFLLYSGAGGSTVMTALADNFMNPTSILQTTLRFLAMPAYIQTVFKVIGQAYGASSDAIVGTFLSGGNYGLAPRMSEFMLSASLTGANIPFLANALFNTTQPYSITSLAGCQQWLTLAGAMKSGDTATSGAIQTALMTKVFNNVAADLNTFFSWYGKMAGDVKTYVKAADEYSYWIATGLNANIASSPYNSTDFTMYVNASDPATLSVTTYRWQQLGALQFGAGLIGGLLAPTTAGSPPSLSNSFGLMASITTFEGLIKPLELPAGVKYGNPTVYAQLLSDPNSKFFFSPPQAPKSLGPYLSLSQSLKFLTQFYGVGPSAAGTAMGGLLVALRAYYFTLIQHPAGAAALPTVHSQVMADPAGLAIINQFGITADTAVPIYLFAAQYIGPLFSGHLHNLKPTGCTPENNGLFICVTVKQLLFGYMTGFGKAFPGLLGSTLRNEPGGKTLDQLKAEYMVEYGPNRKYAMNTGRTDIDAVGQLLKYRGTAQISNECSMHDPNLEGICNITTSAANALNYYPLFNNGHVEVIAGCHGGRSMAPFQENNVIPEVKLYIDQANRLITLKYTGEVDFDGVTLRRYKVRPEIFFLKGENGDLTEATNDYKNDRKYYTGDIYGNYDGLVMDKQHFGGSPGLLGVPHHTYVPSKFITYSSNTRSPSPALWDTSLNVEPITGLTFDAHKRLELSWRLRLSEFQLNKNWPPGGPAATTPDPTINRMYTKVFNWGFNETHDGIVDDRAIILPQFFVDEYKSATADDIKKFKSQITGLRKMAKDLQVGLCTAGAVGFIATAALLKFLTMGAAVAV